MKRTKIVGEGKKKNERSNSTNETEQRGGDPLKRSRRYLGIFRCNYGLIRFTTNLLNRDRSRIHESYSEQKDRERERERETKTKREREKRDGEWSEPVRIECNLQSERIPGCSAASESRKHSRNHFYCNIFKPCAEKRHDFPFETVVTESTTGGARARRGSGRME